MSTTTMFMNRKTQHRKDVSPPKWIYEFNRVPMKIQAWYFHRYKKYNLKIYIENKGIRIAKAIFKKKIEGGGISLYGFKTFI